MFDKYYVGRKAADINTGKALLPFSKVVIIVGDDENGQRVYEAGNDTGRTLEVTNPWGTQQIANDILARIQGYEYRPYSANGALISDNAELGDAVTVGGVYSVLASQDITFNSLMTSEIEASGADETDNEFGIYADSTAKDLKRKVNTIATRLTVEFGKIESEITDTATGLSTRITQNANSITSEVTRATTAEGNLSSRITQNADSITSEVSRATTAEGTLSSKIDQRLDSITLSVSSSNGSSTFTLKDGSTTLSTKTLNLTVDHANISGRLTASQIDASELYVSAAHVTGTLTIGQLPSTVAELSDIPTDSDITTITENTIRTTSVYARNLEVDAANIYGTLTAGALETGSIDLGGAGTMTLTSASSGSYAVDITSYAAMRLTAYSGSIYFAASNVIGLGNETSIAGSIYPTSTNRYSCGTSGFKWTDVYATNATIQTSDKKKKKAIKYGLSEFEGFFDGLAPCTYKFKDGHGRTHFGMIAQDIENLIDDCGLDTMDVAAFIKSWNEEEQGYDYALRYGEFIPLLIWEVQQLKEKVKELTA